MNRPGWSCLFFTTNSLSKVRHIRLSAIVVLFILLFAVSGTFGLVRLVSFTTSFCMGKFGVYEARRENEGLLLKMRFLDKFIQKEAVRIEELITFEDKARLNYGMSPISEDVRKAGIGGKPSPEEMMVASLMDPVVMKAEAIRESLSVLLRQAELQDSTFTRMANYVEWLHKRWAERPSIWPVSGRITSPYGYRYHPIYGYNMLHEGIDIANKIWTPVFATADGIVKMAGIKDYYGRIVILEHPQSGFETAYAHLQRTAVTEGQVIKRGDLIGYLGNSGRSTGPHLHYEVRTSGSGRYLNPSGFILPYDRVVD